MKVSDLKTQPKSSKMINIVISKKFIVMKPPIFQTLLKRNSAINVI